MAKIKQLVQDFTKNDLTHRGITPKDEKQIKSLEKEIVSLKSNISKMKRSRGQYSRWMNYFIKSDQTDKLFESEESKDKLEQVISAQETIVDEINQEINFKRGLDSKLRVAGYVNLEYDRKELFDSKDQLRYLREEKESPYYKLKSPNYKRALKIQTQKVQAALESIKTGKSTDKIYKDEKEKFKDVIEDDKFEVEGDYPLFYDIVGRSITIY